MHTMRVYRLKLIESFMKKEAQRTRCDRCWYIKYHADWLILFYLIFALHCILTVDIISTTDKKVELAKIFLNDDFLPWVDSAKHVGNTMERDNSFTVDIRNKRGCFIGRIHSILQEVHFANPLVKMELISLYASSFYGSALWKLHWRGQWTPPPHGYAIFKICKVPWNSSEIWESQHQILVRTVQQQFENLLCSKFEINLRMCEYSSWKP